MKIIDKLFYKKDEKTNEKTISKLKIFTILLLFIFVFGSTTLMPADVTEVEARELIYKNTPGESIEDKSDYILAAHSFEDKNYISSSKILTLARESGINLDHNDNLFVVTNLISYDKNKDDKLNKTELMNLLDYKK